MTIPGPAGPMLPFIMADLKTDSPCQPLVPTKGCKSVEQGTRASSGSICSIGSCYTREHRVRSIIFDEDQGFAQQARDWGW